MESVSVENQIGTQANADIRVWSPYQKRLFYSIAKETENLLVIARAGSAKTSSLVEGARYIPIGKRTLFCAFNKHIQEELQRRIGDRIECLTLHSLGLRGVKQRFPEVEIKKYKCWDIARELVGDDRYDLVDSLVRTTNLCKAMLVDAPTKIDDLMADFNIDTCEEETEKFIQYICQILRKCKEDTTSVDFSDMVWFPFVYGIKPGEFDLVAIDEFQDLTRSQLELAFSVVKKDGRLIAVGDPAQRIYSWNGADFEGFDRFRARFTPKELELPICYRCPRKVVELAQTIVPDIQVYEHAIEGEIIDIDVSELQKYAVPGSVVLSRYNAPLIKHCMKFIKNGIPANILGRDIGEGLLSLVKKSKKKKVDSFLKWLDKWSMTERKKILAKHPNASTEIITDKVECLHNLCDGASTIEEVKTNITTMFASEDEEGNYKKIVLMSSVHKFKGKEADTVCVLMDTLRSFSEEELNINYVAFSRSKRVLYRVNGK
jgi:DNA helicase II / ATP-dependent DNA helicase PcrA